LIIVIYYHCVSRVSVVYQKRLRRERKARKRVQDQLEQELKRRAQLEEMIKAAGAPADALRVLTGAYLSDADGFYVEHSVGYHCHT